MLKKVRVGQLREGMFVHKLVGSWLEHPFWRTSFVLKQRKDIEALRASGIAEVWIDTAKGLDVAAEERGDSQGAAPEQDAAPTVSLAQARVSMGEEVASAKKVYAKSRHIVRSLFSEARLGRVIDTGSAEELVDEISRSLQRNPWALISVARLKTADEYTYMHCVAVCALMMALARQLGLDERETREAGLAGMMHDIGKARMPLEILNKPGRLTDEEMAVMKRHSEEGHKMLLEMRSSGEIALDVCLHHHEKMDGTGYPHNLPGDKISLHARMGAVCDVYDAVTSNRPYKQGWDPTESLRKMATWAGHFDEHIFHAFVKSVGIYPVGSFVRLESGLMGVVVEQGEASLLQPKVKTFFSAKSRAYVLPKIVDLAQARSNDRIVGPEDPAAWGIDGVEHFLA